MRVLPWLVTLVVTLWVPRVFAAVMVLPVDGTNIDPIKADAIGQTLASSYQVERRERVVPPAKVKEALAAGGSYEQIARQLNATEYLYVTVVQLDTRIVITASRYAPDGTLIYSAKITALGLDDVEAASDRLAKSLVQKKPTTDTRELDNVTSTEGQQPKKVAAGRVPSFKGGFIYPIGWKERVRSMMSLAFALRLEGEQHFLEVAVGFAVPAGTEAQNAYGGVFSDIGMNFYLMHEATSPYVGFGLMPRLMSADVTNLAAYGQGGVMFFRDSSMRFYSELRAAQNLLPVGFRNCSGFESCSTRRLYPTEISLSVGVGF